MKPCHELLNKKQKNNKQNPVVVVVESVGVGTEN